MPDELAERILHYAIETSTYSVSDHKCQTRSILQTCCRFKMIEFSGKRFLPRLYIHPIDAFPKLTFNGKIKISVRKTTATFGSASGVAMGIVQHADRNWRSASAWLILSPQEYSRFIIDRVYGENK